MANTRFSEKFIGIVISLEKLLKDYADHVEQNWDDKYYSLSADTSVRRFIDQFEALTLEDVTGIKQDQNLTKNLEKQEGEGYENYFSRLENKINEYKTLEHEIQDKVLYKKFKSNLQRL